MRAELEQREPRTPSLTDGDPAWRERLASDFQLGPAETFERLLALAGEARRTIERQAERIAELERASVIDELTGIANARGFAESLRRELDAATRHGGGGALIYVDVDALKEINDHLGHEAGDAVLRHVARTLSEHVRPSDVVGRLHGDEFAILLTRMDVRASSCQARAVIERIAGTPIEHRGAVLTVQVSAGLAHYGPGCDEATLLRRADRAMYRRKRAQRPAGRRGTVGATSG